MSKLWLYIVTLISAMLVASCDTEHTISMSDLVVPDINWTGNILGREELKGYTLAYCWRSPERDAFGLGRTDIVVSSGDGSWLSTITYPSIPSQSTVSLGCLGREDSFRTGGYSLAWRSAHDQLTTVTGVSGPPGDNLYFVTVLDGLSVEISDNARWEHERYFYHPATLAWSPAGEWLVTIGEDADGTFPWQNIWLYNPDTEQGVRVTSVRQAASYVSNPSWSSDGQYLAIAYDSTRSGIGIVRLQDLSYVEVSDENQPALSDWRYVPGESLELRSGKLTLSPQEILQLYLADSSIPAWIDQDQRIAFIAPTSADRVALFIVNLDGTDLQEFLPGLPGLTGLPKLSPDGQQLAFVRYPGWETRDRAEIALVDLETKDITSLIVLPAPSNGDELYISGLDWTPDGKYLAFSSNHAGQSDVYIISADGEAWVNLTSDTDGDAVNPVWQR